MPALGSARRGSTLDARASEAVDLFVQVLARCGFSPDDIAEGVHRACRRIPRSMVLKARAALREMDDASHVLTLWFSDLAYLDRRGRPIPLPLRGPAGSLEGLVARVDPKLDPRELLRYLQRRKVLKRAGRRYVPKDRILILRGAGGPDHFRHLRGVLGMLRTQAHNGQPTRRAEGWYEVFAENPRFPMSARSAFDKNMRKMGNRLMVRADADMHRYEGARKSGEKTIRMGIGIYRFEEGPETSSPQYRQSRPRQKPKASRRGSRG